MQTEELQALLHLRYLPGVGDVRLRALIKRHGSARRALNAPPAELGAAAAAARGTEDVRARVQRALEMLARRKIHVLHEGHPSYPARLRDLHDPPCLLFAFGRLELLHRVSVAVIGTRACTAYGAGAGRFLSRGLAEAGVVVVSGLARGVDTVAHLGALDGGTIAVLGNGIDVVYPRQNHGLQRQIARQGLLLTEFSPGEPALPHNFPRRNRIIAALSSAVVVVEASQDSGTLITVDHALDIGRDIFAVPGPIGRQSSAGTNALIQDGAMLVTSAEEVVQELAGGNGGAGLVGHRRREREGKRDEAGYGGPLFSGMEPPVPPEQASRPQEEDRRPDSRGRSSELLEHMDIEPKHVDDLATACGMDAATVLVELLELELAGDIKQLAGMRFVRSGGS